MQHGASSVNPGADRRAERRKGGVMDTLKLDGVEMKQALRIIREATEGALDDCGLVEAVAVLISQRDNARDRAETFRAKLRALGHEFV